MELRTYLSIINRRKWIIIVSFCLLIFLTFLVTNFLPNKYASTTRLRILTPKSGGANYVDFNIYYATRLMNTYASLASSTAMTQEIKDKLNLIKDPTINVSVIADSELFTITVEEKDPTLSAVIANTVAEILIARSKISSESVKSSAENAINSRLDQLNKELDITRKVYKRLIVPFNQNNNRIIALNNQILNDQQLYISLINVYEQNIQLPQKDAPAISLLKNRISDLEKQINTNKDTVDQMSKIAAEDSTQIASAQGDITLKEQEYTTLITQLDQIQTLEIIQGGNQLVIEEKAVTPQQPSSPNHMLIITIGFLLSIFISIIIAFIVENLDDSIQNIQQIEIPIGVTDFGEVYLTNNPFQKFMSRFRQNDLLETKLSIRNLYRQIQKQSLKMIAVCGTEPHDSYSAITTHIAIEYALSGMKVLLIDANLTTSNLNRFYPDLKGKDGLSEYLNGEMTPELIIHSTDITSLFILPVGQKGSSSNMLFSSKKMLTLLQTLKKEYELIIVEIPSVNGEYDIEDLVSRMNGLVIILQRGRSKVQNVKFVTKQLYEINAPLIGYLLAIT